MNCS
jgi:hypothetical protein